MSVLSELRDELHKLADRAGSADQPDPLAEASRALPERVRDIITEAAAKLAAVLAELIPAAPAEPAAEPPAGDAPPDNPEAGG